MELVSYFLFLQEQIKDIIIISEGGKGVGEGDGGGPRGMEEVADCNEPRAGRRGRGSALRIDFALQSAE
jgi:hypothetical protein